MTKDRRYQRSNQKTHINEGQRTQWPKIEDTKGVTRIHISMKDREHNGQMFEDTKEVIRRHKSMKDREHNDQSLKIPKV